jgi:hypothetical protein
MEKCVGLKERRTWESGKPGGFMNTNKNLTINQGGLIVFFFLDSCRQAGLRYFSSRKGGIDNRKIF